MERTLKKNVILIGNIAFTTLIVFNNIYVPNYITDSENKRFNQWVTYFSNCEGYIVEYKDFDAFKGGENTIQKFGGNMASDIMDVRNDTGFVTVYFDWEKDVIFYIGSDLKSELLYCYLSTF